MRGFIFAHIYQIFSVLLVVCAESVSLYITRSVLYNESFSYICSDIPNTTKTKHDDIRSQKERCSY